LSGFHNTNRTAQDRTKPRSTTKSRKVDEVADQDDTTDDQHTWVQMDVTEVEPVVGDDGEPALFAKGETETGVGCWKCDEGLTSDKIGTPCAGMGFEEIIEGVVDAS
jgi:L,D-peptidoglycan transpeptidase YkuD (ErfK/YbiS/YcfS/YnhG family)